MGSGKYEVEVRIRDSKETSHIVPYQGVVKGKQKLTRFEGKAGGALSDDEWRVLNVLGWAVITIHFDSPIEPNEPRWLRLLGRGGRLAQNKVSFLEHLYLKSTGMLVDRFDIVGPIDVKDRIVTHLRTAGQFPASIPLSRALSASTEKLLTEGIEAPMTETLVKDWRINIFWRGYRHISDPVLSGDVVAGPGENWIQFGDGKTVRCFQYRAGVRSDVSTNSGRFVVSVRALDVPLLIPMLPWIGVALALLGIVLAIIPLRK